MNQKIFLGLALAFLFLPLASASDITRSFSKDAVLPGETITVTLDVSVTGGESYYLLDDAVPAGWTIVNPDPETQAGHVKVAVIQNAASTRYTYEAQAPQSEGVHYFSGTYMFEGMTAEGAIGGDQSVTAVRSASLNQGTLVSILVIIAALVISAVLYKSKYRKHGKR